MAYSIGARIGVDGEAEYRKQMQNIIQQAKTLDSEMKLVTSSFGDNSNALEKNFRVSKTLESQIENQKKKVDLLRDMVQKATEAYGESDTRTLKYKESLNKAEAKLNEMKNTTAQSIAKTDGLNDSVEKIDESFDDAGKSGLKFSDILKANVLSDVIVGGMKSLGNAAIAVAKGLGRFAKEAVADFAELEQNISGSESVFGQYASSIQSSAEEAYRVMGTTQSEYLATANKIGSLFQGSGLDVQRSAELSAQAMQRAADVASIMGIDTASALEAVTGAAKGNYTMMDNLGVAMNATTLDAYAVSKGFDKAFSKMSNAEKAELAMQYFFENTEKYAGNFERETATTVSGALGMLTSSFQTFVAGLGNADADIENLTMNVVDSFLNVVTNIVPVIENIVNTLPTIIDAILPAAAEMTPKIIGMALSIIQTLVTGLLQALPQVATQLPEVLVKLISFILDALPKVLQAAIMIIKSLAEGIGKALPELIPAAVSAVVELVETLIDNLDLIIGAAMELVKGLALGVIKALPILLAKLPYLINSLVQTLLEAIPLIINVGTEVLGALLDNSDAIMDAWFDNLPTLISGLINAIIENGPKIGEAGFKLLKMLFVKIPEALVYYGKKFPTFWNGIFSEIGKVWNKFKDIGGNLLKGLWAGMSGVKDWLWGKVKNMLYGLTDKIKGFFGIHSPSRLFEDEIGANLAKGIGIGFEDTMPDITKQMNASMPTALDTSVTNFGGVNIVVNGAQGQNVTELADAVADRIQNMVNRKEAVFA